MKKSIYNNKQKGFVALVSTLIITIVMMLVITRASTSSFFARFDVLGSEFKRRSLGLSEACLNAALLKIAQNYNYAPTSGGEVIQVGQDYCAIRSVTYGDEDQVTHRKLATVQTSAIYPSVNGSFSTSKLKASIQNPAFAINPSTTSDSITISTWDEIVNIE